MLRRRKADVAIDLPDKQEQVMELELDRRHRRVYQTYLQRERQKVLGLLGDFEQNRFEIFRSLTLLRQASLDVSLVDPKHRGCRRPNWRPWPNRSPTWSPKGTGRWSSASSPGS